MGYTHYWRRKPQIDKKAFANIIADFQRLMPELAAAGVKLAGPDGTGEVLVTEDLISFNGSTYCGHPSHFDLVIPWPDLHAAGIFAGNPISGTWFAGHTLTTRACPGDCSCDTFYFPRVYDPQEWEKPENGLYFQFCKTAFRPYDLAVTVFLVVAKHHLESSLVIASDGTEENWFDAKLLCHIALGYGLGFTLDG